VQENRWFYTQPDYPCRSCAACSGERALPRTSVGNNLSDLARRLPELVYGLVEELVAGGDNNSYWIAYRACRNLVKQDPVRSWTCCGGRIPLQDGDIQASRR